MIEIENRSGRRRSYRIQGETVWVEPGEKLLVEGDLPAKDRVRAYAESGLFLRAQRPQEGAPRAEALPSPGSTVVAGLYGAGGGPASVEIIPADWRDMPWLLKRALASSVAGYPVKTKAEAETVIAAKLAAANA